MKKFFEKITFSQKTADMYVGFSHGSLKWVVTQGKKNEHGQRIIEDFGTVFNIQAHRKNTLPKDFSHWAKKSHIHYVISAGMCTHTIIEQEVDMQLVHKHIPGFVVSQKLLTKTNTKKLYQTVSINMSGIKKDIDTLSHIKLTPREIYHVARGYTHHNKDILPGAYFVVSFGQTHSWVAWINNDEILYQVDIPIGKINLIEAITKIVNVSQEEAEKILVKYGVTRSHPDKKVITELYTVLEPMIRIINDWIKEYSQYRYIPENFAKTPNMIYVTGMAGNIVGIEQYFVLQTGISAENLGKKKLFQYTTKLPGNISDLEEYAPLLYMIK